MSIFNCHAFIDESGDTGLDLSKAGTSHLYVVAAVIVRPNSLISLRDAVKKVRKTHFQTGEMKSVKVGDKHTRRLRILDDVRELPFHVLAVIIDKGRLCRNSGFQYRKSFRKYMHGLLDNELYRRYPNLQVIADEQGSAQFMRGFRKYVLKRHQPDLFSESSFGFIPSDADPLLQLADFMAGTVAKCWDPSVQGLTMKDYKAHIGVGKTGERLWPPALTALDTEYPEDGDNDDYSASIREAALRAADRFFQENEGSDDLAVHQQLACLEHLVYELQTGDPHRYIPSGEIIGAIPSSDIEPISDHHFRSKIVAPLRDSGVLIASSTRGYKLPTCLSDCYDFVERSNGTIAPLLSRLASFRESVRMATHGSIDLLEGEVYAKIRRAILGTE